MKSKCRWCKNYERFIGTERYFYLTPTRLSLYYCLKPLLERYARGKFLDIGAGNRPYLHLLEDRVSKYIGIDPVKSYEGLSLIARGEALPFKDNVFDSLFCSQVLEHTPHPWSIMREIKRVLKDEGEVILAVPHLTYLHGEPDDYYRFTKHGIRFLMQEAGVEPLLIHPAGGLISFVLTPLFILMLIIFGKRAFLHRVFLSIMAWPLRLIVSLDESLDREKIYALNYVCIGRKIK